MTSGILNVNKPSGITSFGVVAKVRELISEKHAGHAGTLDPLATGVLPVLVGKATRISEYFLELRKTYRAVIELGSTSDTYDAEGDMISRGDISGIDLGQIERALQSFKGEIIQIPPMFSAVKHEGKPLYELARKGIDVEQKPRKAVIYRIEIISYNSPLLTIDVECSKGTYIRSLANDLGEVLGCGAFLKSLVRTRYGEFDITETVTLEQLEEAVKQNNWQKFLYPIDFPLSDIPKVFLDSEKAEMVTHGIAVGLDGTEQDLHGKRLRAYSPDGSFFAMLRFDGETGKWQPEKVFLEDISK